MILNDKDDINNRNLIELCRDIENRYHKFFLEDIQIHSVVNSSRFDLMRIPKKNFLVLLWDLVFPFSSYAFDDDKGLYYKMPSKVDFEDGCYCFYEG